MATRVREAVVLVLGDVGRSPRMQYHALSLAQLEGVHVSLVGYAGEKCCPPVEASGNITQIRMRPPEKKPAWLPFVLFGPFKVICQILQLFWILCWGIPRPSWILVQNPPSIPTLLVAWLVCRLRGSALIVDWYVTCTKNERASPRIVFSPRQAQLRLHDTRAKARSAAPLRHPFSVVRAPPWRSGRRKPLCHPSDAGVAAARVGHSVSER